MKPILRERMRPFVRPLNVPLSEQQLDLVWAAVEVAYEYGRFDQQREMLDEMAGASKNPPSMEERWRDFDARR